MKYKSKLLMTMLFALLSVASHAYEFWSNGLYFKITSESDRTVAVCYGKPMGSYSGQIVVPATVTNDDVEYTVTSIGYRAFENSKNLKGVTLPESLTSIEGDAFNSCSSLTKITFNNYENSSLASIGNQAFYGCSSLTSITLPESVTSIGDRAFYGCSSLTSITLPESVTSIGNTVFRGCSSLTSIILPKSLRSIGSGAFYGCSSLTSIILPESLTSIGSAAFESCSNLTNIILPESLTSIGSGAFFACSNLTSITIPGSVKTIDEQTFYGCTNLASVTILNSVTHIGGYAFAKCSSLASVTIPNSVTDIGQYAFNGCKSLVSVTIPGSVTSIGNYAFYACSSLNEVFLHDGTTTLGDYAFSGTNISRIEIPSTVNNIGICALRTEAFQNNKLAIKLNAGYEYLKYEYFRYSGSGSIILYVPYIDYSYHYANSSALEKYDGGITYHITPTYRVYFNNDELDAYSVLSDNTLGYVDGYKVEEKEGIITIPNAINYEGAELAVVAANINGLTEKVKGVIVGENVSNFDNYNTMLQKCKYILLPQTKPEGFEIIMDESTVFVPSTNYGDGTIMYANLAEYYTENGHYFVPISQALKTSALLFSADSTKTNMIVPETATSKGVPYKVSRICKNAFADMPMQSIVLPDNIVEVEDGAFKGCTNLNTVSLGKKLRKLGDNAFKDCIRMERLAVDNTTPPTCTAAAFGDIDVFGCVLYVPASAIDKYAAAEGWKEFVYIEPIDDFEMPEEDPVEIAVSGLYDGNSERKDVEINTVGTIVRPANCTPNALLVYDNERSLSTIGENVVVRDGDGNWVANEVVLTDAEPLYSPYDVTANSISYKRTFDAVAWEPLYLPIAMEYDDWKNVADVAYVNNVHQFDDDSDGVVDRTLMEYIIMKGGCTKANVPYIIRPHETGDIDITLSNAVLTATPAEDGAIDCSSTTLHYTLTGYYQPLTDIGDLYLLNGKEFAPDGDGVLVPFRMSLAITSRDGSPITNAERPARVRLMVDGVVIGDEGAATSINNFTKNISATTTYDLQGRSITQPSSGLYIRNGKKVVVR